MSARDLATHYFYSFNDDHRESLQPASEIEIPPQKLVAFNESLFSAERTLSKVHFDQKYANWLPSHEVSIALPEPSSWLLLALFTIVIYAARRSAKRQKNISS